MNFITVFIASLVLIAFALLSIGIGVLAGRKNAIKQGSCGRNTTQDGMIAGCGRGVEQCCTRQ